MGGIHSPSILDRGQLRFNSAEIKITENSLFTRKLTVTELAAHSLRAPSKVVADVLFWVPVRARVRAIFVLVGASAEILPVVCVHTSGAVMLMAEWTKQGFEVEDEKVVIPFIVRN